MDKDITDYLWDVTEEEYREDGAIHYSQLSSYAKEGIASLTKEKEKTVAMSFGSIVDCLLTDNKNFYNRYYVSNGAVPSDKIKAIVSEIPLDFNSIRDVHPDSLILAANEQEYQKNWKDETRVKKIIEEGEAYFLELKESDGKTIISSDDFTNAVACSDAIRTGRFTEWIFDRAESMDVDVYCQPKLKCSIYDWNAPHLVADPLAWQYQPTDTRIAKCMIDMLMIDHENKIIQAIDFKTTHVNEHDFNEQFEKYYYDIQACLYNDLVRRTIRNKVYPNYDLNQFMFVVVNKDSLTPLIYEYSKSGYISQVTWKDKYNNIHRPWYEYAAEIEWQLQNNELVYSKQAVENQGILTIIR